MNSVPIYIIKNNEQVAHIRKYPNEILLPRIGEEMIFTNFDNFTKSGTIVAIQHLYNEHNGRIDRSINIYLSDKTITTCIPS